MGSQKGRGSPGGPLTPESPNLQAPFEASGHTGWSLAGLAADAQTEKGMREAVQAGPQDGRWGAAKASRTPWGSPGAELVRTAGESRNGLFGSIQNKNNEAGMKGLLGAKGAMPKA